MLTMLQELNIDCFQGYGNSYCKDYHKANNGMQRTALRAAADAERYAHKEE